MRKGIFRDGLSLLASLIFFAGCTTFSNPVTNTHNRVYFNEGNRQNICESFKRERAPDDKKTRESIFNEDEFSLQAMVGYFSSSACSIGTDTSDFRYTQLNLRLGRMMGDPIKIGVLPKGNLETLIQVSSSNFSRNPGNDSMGVAVLLRYNIVQDNWKIVPYIQTGVGIIHTNVHKDYSQRAIGQSIEFTPQVSLGFRYLLSENWSIDAEGMFHHISNAGLDERNDGVNSVGVFAGFTYNF